MYAFLLHETGRSTAWKKDKLRTSRLLNVLY